MSAKRIRGDYAELTQIAKTFGENAQRITANLQRLKQEKSGLQNGDWLGQGATAFYAEFDSQVLPALQHLAQALASAAQVTFQISHIIKQAEYDAAACFQLPPLNGTNVSLPAGYEGAPPVPAPTPAIASTPTPTPPPNRPDIGAEFNKFKDNRQPYTATPVGYPVPGSFREWLAQRLGHQTPIDRSITDQEAAVLDELLLWDLPKMGDIRDESFAAAREQFDVDPNDPNFVGITNDNPVDAFRHAYWSARLTQEYGADWARRFTNAHENKPGNEAARDFMDRWNNDLGIRIAQQHPNASPEELRQLIAQAVHNGQAVYIPGADQYPLSSSERYYLTENGPLAYTDQDPVAQQLDVPPGDPLADTSS